jgi:rSAM/selenodomain-associated transferase 2
VPVTVIIPALNEEARIGAAIDSAFACGAIEVIVADCGSADATCALAAARNARLIAGERMRARAMNRAAAEARGDVVIFLHADTLLPSGAAEAAERAIAAGAELGGFRLRFAEKSPRLRVAETMINLRATLTRRPWGDQAQFVARDAFIASGGFREIPIMEDYELAMRAKRRVLLPLVVTTSGRRFLEKGVLRTAFINWRIILSWRLGISDADSLARIYRR